MATSPAINRINAITIAPPTSLTAVTPSDAITSAVFARIQPGLLAPVSAPVTAAVTPPLALSTPSTPAAEPVRTPLIPVPRESWGILGIPEELLGGIESVKTNVGSLSEARLVLVADTHHGDTVQTGNIRRFLSTCPKRGDVVLVEGVTHSITPTTPFFCRVENAAEKGVIEQGWEDGDKYIFCRNYLHMLERAQSLHEEVPAAEHRDRALFEQIENKNRELLQLCAQAKKETDPEKIDEFLVKMELLQKESADLDQQLRLDRAATSKKAKEHLEILERLIAHKPRFEREVILGRNSSMKASFEEHRQKKVYISAGTDHFLDLSLMAHFEHTKVVLVTFRKHISDPVNRFPVSPQTSAV